jgi:tRNA(Leu) C34 or U34 (ribose-2'-O)-methylase TrmL
MVRVVPEGDDGAVEILVVAEGGEAGGAEEEIEAVEADGLVDPAGGEDAEEVAGGEDQLDGRALAEAVDDAVGAGGLILIDDCTDPFSVEAVRASMGAIFTQKIVQCRWDEFITWLRIGPGQLVGTSLQTDVDYQAPDYQRPCFILTGNEAQGLPETYEAECDLLVKMPMRGKADSLNAAVATAVMAYEVLNQFRLR